MAKLKFFTQYERPEQDFESNDNTVVVERAGYVSAKQQIESFIQSGQLLMASRRSMYDYEVGQEDDDMPIMDNIYEDDPIEMQMYVNKMNELSEQMNKEKQQPQPEKKEPEPEKKEPEPGKTDKKD